MVKSEETRIEFYGKNTILERHGRWASVLPKASKVIYYDFKKVATLKKTEKKFNFIVTRLEAPLALIYAAFLLTLMEYFFIPARAEGWLNGYGKFTWGAPSLEAGIVWSVAF
jgi:hypothetical protein